MQGAVAALAPCRTRRPGGLERITRRATAWRPWVRPEADRAPARLPFSMGKADCKGVRGRSVDLPALRLRDEAHRCHHRSPRGSQDSAPPHQDRQGTAGTRSQLPELRPCPFPCPPTWWDHALPAREATNMVRTQTALPINEGPPRLKAPRRALRSRPAGDRRWRAHPAGAQPAKIDLSIIYCPRTIPVVRLLPSTPVVRLPAHRIIGLAHRPSHGILSSWNE